MQDRNARWLIAIVVAAILAYGYVITWNTAYDRGRVDGISQLGCVQDAQQEGGSTASCFR
jgi:hypothetical protein